MTPDYDREVRREEDDLGETPQGPPRDSDGAHPADLTTEGQSMATTKGADITARALSKSAFYSLLKRFRRVLLFKEAGMFLALLIVGATFAAFNPAFISLTNLGDVARNASFTFIAAVGATFVFAAGGLDLSVGSVLGLGAMVGGLAIVESGLPILVGVLLAVVAGAAIGLLNGVVIHKAGIPALVVTLGMLNAVRGLIFIVTQGQPIFPFPRSFTDIVIARINGVPLMVILALVFAVVGHILLNHFRFGLRALAIGGDFESARLVGINADRLSIVIYVLAGATAALSGILLAARLGTSQASAGTGDELVIIAAVLIGGTSMFGGSATVIGTVIASLLLATLTNGMTIVGLSPFFQNLVVGVVIILAVALDQWRKRHAIEFELASET